MIIQAITGIFVAACAVIPGCQPTPTPAPAPATVLVVPCEGDAVTVYGFDTPTGCDLTPPQQLRVFMEHPAPWSSVEADTFFAQCADAGGEVVDADGDAWVCGFMDY